MDGNNGIIFNFFVPPYTHESGRGYAEVEEWKGGSADDAQSLPRCVPNVIWY